MQSKPISLVFCKPNCVGWLACTQAELINPSRMVVLISDGPVFVFEDFS